MTEMRAESSLPRTRRPSRPLVQASVPLWRSISKHPAPETTAIKFWFAKLPCLMVPWVGDAQESGSDASTLAVRAMALKSRTQASRSR